jgi:hypothetical protein
MQDHAVFFVALRYIFTGLFLAALVAGFLVLRYYQQLFGTDPQQPSENSGARLYSKTLVIAVWAHAVALTGGIAWIMW